MKPHIKSRPSSEAIRSSWKKMQTSSPSGPAPPASPMHPPSAGRPAGNAHAHLCPDAAPPAWVAMLCEDTPVPSARQPHTLPLLALPSCPHSVLHSVTTGVGAQGTGPGLPAHCGIWGLTHRRGTATLAEMGQKETASELSAQDSHGWRAQS